MLHGFKSDFAILILVKRCNKLEILLGSQALLHLLLLPRQSPTCLLCGRLFFIAVPEPCTTYVFCFDQPKTQAANEKSGNNEEPWASQRGKQLLKETLELRDHTEAPRLRARAVAHRGTTSARGARVSPADEGSVYTMRGRDRKAEGSVPPKDI